ncbi:PREDICTED: probable 3-deoxy-D-manno-octulosonic acid transferase, mitochondrial isoform X2 [Theobroma cacao]|uniref:lipid IVA 3-deoxy-D-manno-octulosonic acid transferase n=1 Tax=Theobroma cacao TaxID=3641 RepID=A0AB32WD97_THECC|nr:PREDICTED: probable 3-deoxy-D-manno-octulosonic acid transferase, mitochondrial isoform X2 [Theobroma cacao]
MGPEKPFPAQSHRAKPKPSKPCFKKRKRSRLPKQAEGKMAMAASRGELVYKIYRALTYGLSPLLHLHLHWRKFRGLEHPLRWPERLGRPSLPRTPGLLLWFHAVSLGEGMAAIPVIKCCSQLRPDVNILMTTTTFSAFEVLKNRIPANVIYQFAPIDTPSAMDAFLGYWKPNGIVIMESELWPNLIVGASKCGIGLALLNARLSAKSFRNWSRPVLFPLISLLLSKFSLIVPLSSVQAIHFQLLQAPPFSINFSGDLKYAVDECEPLVKDVGRIEDLQKQLSQKRVWMAASIHRGEEEIMLGVHKGLTQTYPDLVTIIVPRHPQHGKEIAEELQKGGKTVALRSQHEKLIPGTSIYVVDTLGELRQLYKLSPIAVIGGSFFPGLAGHNISEAAAAGCAVLTGHHVGHFSHMVIEMQQLNPLSVMQVSGKLDLEKALGKLFSDAKILESRQKAAKEAFNALSSSVVTNAWNLLNFHFLRQVFS